MRFVSLQVLVISVALVGCSRTAPLQSPRPLQAHANMATTEAAIGSALSRRGWMIQSRRPGVVSAVLMKRDHKVWVNIQYGHQRVQVTYAGSQNLRESREGRVIYVHSRVNTWLRNLNQDLAMALQRSHFAPARAGQPPPPRRPPGSAY